MGIVSISPRKNRIHIKFLDMSREELEITVMKIEVAGLELNPNFTCLIDFRLAGSLLMENKDLLERGQKALMEIGIGKAVPLVTQQQIASPQFQIFDIVRSGYEIEYATSTKSAKRILDNYTREIEQLSKQTRRNNSLFRIIDRNGWEDELKFADYKHAIKRLKKVRQSGRSDAIIINVKI